MWTVTFVVIAFVAGYIVRDQRTQIADWVRARL